MMNRPYRNIGFFFLLLLVLVMFVGRLGPLTIALLGAVSKEPGARYTEEAVTIG